MPEEYIHLPFPTVRKSDSVEKIWASPRSRMRTRTLAYNGGNPVRLTDRSVRPGRGIDSKFNMRAHTFTRKRFSVDNIRRLICVHKMYSSVLRCTRFDGLRQAKMRKVGFLKFRTRRERRIWDPYAPSPSSVVEPEAPRARLFAIPLCRGSI